MGDAHVLALCDDLFLQGHQLAEWIIDYVDLEESLAVGSISQELLAHSAALMGICGISAVDRDERIFGRPADHWFPSRVSFLPERNWPATVIRAFLLNQAVLAIRPFLAVPDRPRVQQLAELINAEEDLHANHWKRWVAILARDSATSEEFQQRTDEALVDAADLFGGLEASNGHSDVEPILGQAELLVGQAAWTEAVTTLLSDCGLDITALSTESVPRRAGGKGVQSMLDELRHARRPDGSSFYEVYQ